MRTREVSTAARQVAYLRHRKDRQEVLTRHVQQAREAATPARLAGVTEFDAMVAVGTYVGIKGLMAERQARVPGGRGAGGARPKRTAADREMREKAARLERRLKELREAEEEEEEEAEDGNGGDGGGAGPSGGPPPPPPGGGAGWAVVRG